MTEYKPGDLVLIRGLFSNQEYYSIIVKKSFSFNSDFYDVYMFGLGIANNIYRENIIKKVK